MNIHNTKAGSHPLVDVSIEINASDKEIFNAWIEPDKLSHWMFGPEVRDEKVISLNSDARKGGRFSFVVERDGKSINHLGTYKEFQPYSRLAFTWNIEWESIDDENASVVTIDITPLNQGCRVHLTHLMNPKWSEYKERTQKGWTFMLGKLKELYV